MLVLALVPAVAAAETLRGRLAEPAGGAPLRLILPDGGSVELDPMDEALDATLRDPQLAERTWELRGARTDGGRFSVERVFTVKDGVLHRVTYYCEICHITTHQPGPCMCCQGVTDLRELPGE